MRDDIKRLAERVAEMDIVCNMTHLAARDLCETRDAISAKLRALARTDHVEDKLGMVAEDRSKWSLHDRVEFALRDAGFDYDEAFNIASVAAAPAPDHSAGVGGMVAKVSAPDGWEFTEGGGVTEVFDIAQWPDIGGIWRDDETGLPVLHAEGDLKDWPSGKINAVLVQVNRAQPADAGADGGK